MLETIAPAAPAEEVTPILPSEALRLGRLVRPRHTPGDILAGSDGACAIGAMLLGWGYSEQDIDRGGLALFSRDPRTADMPSFGLWGQVDYPVYSRFDEAELDGRDGDEAVLAFLRELGL